MEKTWKNDKKQTTLKTLAFPRFFQKNPHFRVPLLEKTNPILTPQISLQPLILQLVTTISFKIPQKKRTQLKPIPKKEKPQLSGDTQAKNKKMKFKANLDGLFSDTLLAKNRTRKIPLNGPILVIVRSCLAEITEMDRDSFVPIIYQHNKRNVSP